MSGLPAAAAALIAVGLHGLLVLAHPVRRVLAANVFGSGVFVLLVSLCRDANGHVDWVPQAMVLTGIVVSFAATALALFLARFLESRPGDDTDRPH